MTRDGSFLQKNASGKPATAPATGSYLYQRGGECRSCHVVGDGSQHDAATDHVKQESIMVDGTPAGFDFSKDPADPANVKFIGIQCESCHGPGANHIAASADDKKKAITRTPSYKKTCIACHNKDPRREWPATGASDAVVNKGGIHNYAPHPQILAYGEGGGYHFGETMPTSTHASKIGNGCVNCHVVGTAPSNHKIAIWLDRDKFVPTCQQCHGSTFTSANILSYQAGFKMASQKLKDMLEAYKKALCKKVYIGVSTDPRYAKKEQSTALADIGNLGNYCAEWDDSPAAVKTSTATPSAITNDPSTWSNHMKAFDGAYWNYRLLDAENSDGIHSPAYEQALLRLSYNKLATDLNTSASGSYTLLQLKP